MDGWMDALMAGRAACLLVADTVISENVLGLSQAASKYEHTGTDRQQSNSRVPARPCVQMSLRDRCPRAARPMTRTTRNGE